jgi:hypothetical protein
MENKFTVNAFNLLVPFNRFQVDIHENAKNKGFWDRDRSTGESIALIHEELSDALKADREGILEDRHLPHYTRFAVKLADTVIRVMDLAEKNSIPLAQIIGEKHSINTRRERLHGKKY